MQQNWQIYNSKRKEEWHYKKLHGHTWKNIHLKPLYPLNMLIYWVSSFLSSPLVPPLIPMTTVSSLFIFLCTYSHFHVLTVMFGGEGLKRTQRHDRRKLAGTSKRGKVTDVDNHESFRRVLHPSAHSGKGVNEKWQSDRRMRRLMCKWVDR